MTRQDWIRIQTRLKNEGFPPGPIDGIRGRLTIRAVRTFQRENGLAVDGIVGPNTMVALFPDRRRFEPSGFDDMPWMEEAGRYLGLREDRRRGYSNSSVVALAEPFDIDYSSDDIPWCGLFVGHCMAVSLPDEPMPELVLWSRSWLHFGQKARPQPGAVMVFWRGSPQGSKGHVGFYCREDETSYEILGGNQSNRVSHARIAKSRLLGARWPTTALPALGEARVANMAGELSRNEA